MSRRTARSPLTRACSRLGLRRSETVRKLLEVRRPELKKMKTISNTEASQLDSLDEEGEDCTAEHLVVFVWLEDASIDDSKLNHGGEVSGARRNERGGELSGHGEQGVARGLLIVSQGRGVEGGPGGASWSAGTAAAGVGVFWSLGRASRGTARERGTVAEEQAEGGTTSCSLDTAGGAGGGPGDERRRAGTRSTAALAPRRSAATGTRRRFPGKSLES